MSSSLIQTAFLDDTGGYLYIGGANSSGGITYRAPISSLPNATWSNLSCGLPGNTGEHVRLFGRRPYDGKVIGVFEHVSSSGYAYIDGFGSFNPGTSCWVPETYDSSAGAISSNSLAAKQFAYASNGDVYVVTITGPGDIYKWDHTTLTWKMGRTFPYSTLLNCSGCGGEYFIIDFNNGGSEELAWGGEGSTGSITELGVSPLTLNSATANVPDGNATQNLFAAATDGTTFMVAHKDVNGNPLQFTTLPLFGSNSWTPSSASSGAVAYTSVRDLVYLSAGRLWLAAFQGSSITGPIRYSSDHVHWTSFSNTFPSAASSNIRSMSVGVNTGAVVIYANGPLYFNRGFISSQTSTSVAVTPANSSITVGSTEQLTATCTTGSSSTNCTGQVSWSTNNSSVATISSSGVVDGKASGIATITAVYQGSSSSASVSVTSPAHSPSCSITAPMQSSVLSGNVPVSGAGMAGSGVMSGMQFLLDGSDLGPWQTGAGPYRQPWNTANSSAGNHTLSCTCTDSGGGHANCPAVSVTVVSRH